MSESQPEYDPGPAPTLDSAMVGTFQAMTHRQMTSDPHGIRVDGETLFAFEELDGTYVDRAPFGTEDPFLVYVETNDHRSQGTLIAHPGDWIFFNDDGSPYPVSHEQVTSMYELVEGGPPIGDLLQKYSAENHAEDEPAGEGQQ
jgi:hypothetical protein